MNVCTKIASQNFTKQFQQLKTSTLQDQDKILEQYTRIDDTKLTYHHSAVVWCTACGKLKTTAQKTQMISGIIKNGRTILRKTASLEHDETLYKSNRLKGKNSVQTLKIMR